jgi:hypothetical protein
MEEITADTKTQKVGQLKLIWRRYAMNMSTG